MEAASEMQCFMAKASSLVQSPRDGCGGGEQGKGQRTEVGMGPVMTRRAVFGAKPTRKERGRQEAE